VNLVDKHSAPSILFAVTEDWYFWSHRQPMAAYLQQQGCEISLATRFNEHQSDCIGMGLECVAVTFERSLRHPLRDLRAMFGLWRALRDTNPEIVHLVSHKPILLSVLALFANPGTQFVAAFTGMGYLFSSGEPRAWWVQRTVVLALRLLLRRANVSIIVQNEEDRRLLRRERIGRAGRTTIIAGVGVDTKVYAFSALDFVAAPIILLPARLIRDKGVAEFVAAARIVKRSVAAARFVLVGAEDSDNPAAIQRSQIESWVTQGLVEWWGPQDDMPVVYQQARIVCLPSYREGLPKVLLEAAACGRPLVATDVAGCREVCRDGVNGSLVEAQSAESLAAAIIALIATPNLQQSYGAAGRALVEREFSVEKIGQQTLGYYRQVLGRQES